MSTHNKPLKFKDIIIYDYKPLFGISREDIEKHIGLHNHSLRIALKNKNLTYDFKSLWFTSIKECIDFLVSTGYITKEEAFLEIL